MLMFGYHYPSWRKRLDGAMCWWPRAPQAHAYFDPDCSKVFSVLVSDSSSTLVYVASAHEHGQVLPCRVYLGFTSLKG